MTPRLEEAFRKASEFPANDQDVLAAMVEWLIQDEKALQSLKDLVERARGTTGPSQSGFSLYLDELPDVLASISDLSKEEAKDFLDDVVRSREELAKQKVRDPWES